MTRVIHNHLNPPLEVDVPSSFAGTDSAPVAGPGQTVHRWRDHAGRWRFKFLGSTSIIIPEPLAISDFKTANYSIGGVAKTYADLWAAPLVWGDNSISVVADVGLRNSYTGGTTSASATVNAQAELQAAVVGPDVGHSGVMSVRIEQGDSSLAMIDLSVLSSTGTNRLSIDLRRDHPTGAREGAFAVRNNTAVSAMAGGANFDGELNKIAYTMTPTSVSLSLNGGAVVTLETAPADYSAIDLLRLYFATYNAPVNGASATIERIDFYGPQDAAVLPILSTLPPFGAAS